MIVASKTFQAMDMPVVPSALQSRIQGTFITDILGF